MSKEFTLPLITSSTADKIRLNLEGRVWLPMNRVLIAISDLDIRRTSGLIIPNSVAKEESLKKGVVVLKGDVSEDYQSTSPSIGNIVTFGEYAGKRVEFEEPLELKDPLSFHVLSMNEIVMEELNILELNTQQ